MPQPAIHLVPMDLGEEDSPLLNADDDDDDDTNRENPNEVTIDDAISIAGFGKFHYLMVAVMGWANSADAIELLSVSFILPPAEHEMNATKLQLTFLTAVGFAGMILGALFWGTLADIKGRRFTLLICQSINAIFTLASAFSQDFWFLITTRFISGIGVGGTNPIIFVYLVELLPAKNRGKMIGVVSAFFMAGQILVAGLAWLFIPHLDWGVTNKDGFSFNSWRIFLLSSAIPVISSVIAFAFFPESPRYYYGKNRMSEAIAVLKKIHKINKTSTPFPDDLIIKPPEEVEKPGGKCAQMCYYNKEIFTRPTVRKNFLIGSAVMFCLSFSYYGLTMWFPQMLQLMEASNATSVCDPNLNRTANSGDDYNQAIENRVYYESFLQAISSLPGNIIFYLLIDRIGRKLFIGGSLLLSAASIFFIWLVKTHTQSVVVSCVFAGVNVVSWNASSLVMAEMFPTDVRSTARGLQSAFVNRVASVIATVTFGALIDTYCSIPILLSSALMILGTIITYFLPNTTNIAIN